MTILIHFHQSHYHTFKAYYMEYVQVHLSSEFPRLVSYQRFVALIPSVLVPLLAYLQSRYGACTGISFVDSTSLEVCDPKRISQHRVFTADGKRGKTSTGWFYGFKLHLAVNDRGELLSCCLTPGNVDDRTPVPTLVKHLHGKLFSDRGYISAPLTQLLFEQGLHPITRLRKNMKDQLMHLVVLQEIEGRENEEEGVLIVQLILRLQTVWRSRSPVLSHPLLPPLAPALSSSCS
jgi:hypothetical protein